MADRLKDKNALITGGASGIGLAAARQFLREGASVAVADRDSDAIEKAVADLEQEYGAQRAFGIPVDISHSDAVQEAIRTAVEKLGSLNVLVNNAAVRTHQSLAESDAESWGDILSVNVVALNECARHALPHLRTSRGGSIVNVSSAFALTGRPGMGQYDATKAAIVAMTRVLAIEEAGHGVRVNVVCPGSVLTPFTLGRADARGLSEDELIEQGMVPCPLNRWGNADEVAAGILWLASDEASFVTGTALAIDGGLSATAVRAS